MRIVVREDIAAPAAQVFAEVTDFEGFERQALRRGAEVRREGGQGVGATWRAVFPFRGRERTLAIDLARIEAPRELVARMTSGGLRGTFTADLLALSRTTTRLSLTLDLEGRTLTARLLVGSLRLGQGRLQTRADARLKAWSREVEGRWQRGGGRAASHGAARYVRGG